MSGHKNATALAGSRGIQDGAFGKHSQHTIAEAMAAEGYGILDVIHDGQIHRFTHPDDKPGSHNCWYVSYRTAGAYGSWKLDTSHTWRNGKTADNKRLLKQIREYQRHREADVEIIRCDTAREARQLWNSSSQTIIHQYPLNKGITPFGARQKDSAMLVPMFCQNALWNLQRIYPDGGKFFMKGGRVIGAYMPIGNLSDHVLICEGYATGCSLHEHTGAPVAVAFHAGNLQSVAISIRKKYPSIKITVAADNDTATPGNPGLTKGRAAAAAVDGDIIYPDFSDEDFTGTDYNDYLTQGGEL